MKRFSCLICVFGYWLLAKLQRRGFRELLLRKLKTSNSQGWASRCLLAWLVVSDVQSGEPERIVELFRDFEGGFKCGRRTIVACMESAVWLKDSEIAERVLAKSGESQLSKRECRYLKALNNWAFKGSSRDVIEMDGPPASTSLTYVFHFAKAMALDGIGHPDALAHFRNAMREMPIDCWQYQVAMDRCNALLNEA